MQWLISFFAELLSRLIPWMFSGKKMETVAHTDGLDGIDRNEVTGVNDFRPEDLPDI